MVQKIELIYMKIEVMRALLHEKIKIYQDFTHPDIVKLSQEIDELLNQVHEENRKIKAQQQE